jgi:hypothetical protein
LLKSVPKLKDAITSKTIALPVTGTIDKPQIDRAAFQANVRKFADEVLKDAAKGKLDDLLFKGLEKIAPKKP